MRDFPSAGAKNDIRAENDTSREQKMTLGAQNDTCREQEMTLGAGNDTSWEQKMTYAEEMTSVAEKTDARTKYHVFGQLQKKPGSKK